MNIGCSGTVRPGTGIGVLQRAVYPRLILRGHQLIESGNRDRSGGIVSRLLGFAVGLRPARGALDGYFSAVPPLPLGIRTPIVAIVHDLRWKSTRRGLSRAYRKADLARTVRRADQLICISDRTFEDLTEMFPAAAPKSVVAWLGPGLVDEARLGTAPKERGLFLLVGGASHKRNELAAETILELSKTREVRVAGIGVSPAVKETLSTGLGNGACEWHTGISDEAVAVLYDRAEYFMLLGRDEGFGLPYIEALVSNCIVIAADQPLTREILVDAAILVKGSQPEEIAREINASESPSEQQVSAVTSRYSWEKFTDAVESALEIARNHR